eukprot:1492938-Amphidinium_carterae.1
MAASTEVPSLCLHFYLLTTRAEWANLDRTLLDGRSLHSQVLARNAMQRSRADGKAVILAGDLNMTHRAVDSHWSLLASSQGVLSTTLPRITIGIDKAESARSIDVGRILRLRHAEALEAHHMKAGPPKVAYIVVIARATCGRP